MSLVSSTFHLQNIESNVFPQTQQLLNIMIRHYIFAILAVVYLLNFTVGIFEIPDNLPIIGNLDEVAASLLLFQSVRQIRERRELKRQRK